MRRLLAVLLCVSLSFSMDACNKKADVENTDVSTEEASVEAPKLNYYEYETGQLTIGYPLDFAGKPSDNGDTLVFKDSEGLWTITFTPLSVQDKDIYKNNMDTKFGNIKDMTYYLDVRTSQTKVDGFDAYVYSETRNPNPENTSDTLFVKEGHQYIVVDYGDTIVGKWGGLLVDLSLPEESVDDLYAVLEDEEVQTILGNIAVNEGESQAGGDGVDGTAVSIPGISAVFPTRWTVSDDGKETIWAMIKGDTEGTIYLKSGVAADPKHCAEAVSEDITEKQYGSRTYYAVIDEYSVDGEETVTTLELYTDFTQKKAFEVTLDLKDATADDLWAYIDGEDFTKVMESIELDPDNYFDIANAGRDEAGFTTDKEGYLDSFKGTATDLELPTEVDEHQVGAVGEALFENNTELKSVTIPEGYLVIMPYAFAGCTSLESVTLPDSMGGIGERAFEGCVNLKSINFGNDMEVIDSRAFKDCESLEEVTFNENLNFIGDQAFAGAGLKSITVPGNVKEIGEAAFSGCKNLMEITLEEGVETIDAYAFSDAGRLDLDTYNWIFDTEENVKATGENYYANGDDRFDKALVIHLPSTLKTVGEYAFNDTFIEGIYMEWCTDAGMLPDFDHDAFNAKNISQVYFTKDTIEAHGSELDEYFGNLADGAEPCWYDEGCHIWWIGSPGAESKDSDESEGIDTAQAEKILEAINENTDETGNLTINGETIKIDLDNDNSVPQLLDDISKKFSDSDELAIGDEKLTCGELKQILALYLALSEEADALN